MAITDDYSEIYVNLSLSPTEFDSTSFVRDINGALVCDSTTDIGSVRYPINYVEFVLYTRYRISGRDMTFVMAGEIILDAEEDIRVGSGIELINVDGANSVTIIPISDELSYKFKVTHTTPNPSYPITDMNKYVNISSRGAGRLMISNMDLDIVDDLGGIRFTGDRLSQDYLFISNCRIFSDNVLPKTSKAYGPGYGITFEHPLVVFLDYEDVFAVNNIFNNKDASVTTLASIIFRLNDRFTSNSSNTNKIVFAGNVCPNVFEMYLIDVSIDTLWTHLYNNTCTGTYTDFTNAPSLPNIPTESVGRYSNMPSFSDGENQFGWTTIPTICAQELYGITDPETDFNYRSTEWRTLTDYTNGGFSGNALDGLFLNTDFGTYITMWEDGYGTRDGKGSLYFEPMTDIEVYIEDYSVTEGNVIAIKNNVSAYDVNFEPSYYEWDIGTFNTTSTSADGEIAYTVDQTGSINVEPSVFSYNEWYSVGGKQAYTIISQVPGVDLVINTYDSVGNLSATFDVGSTVRIEVVNNSDDGVIDTVRLDYNNSYRDFNNMQTSGSTNDVSTTYGCIDSDTIVATIKTNDNRYVYTSKHIDIIDVVPDEYYVDLSLEYEDSKGTALKYVLSDDFEDGSISTDFYFDFYAYYTVVEMWDEKAATNSTAPWGYAKITDGIKDDLFIVNFSFVRDDMIVRPKFSLQFTDAPNILIEWDFTKDRVIIDGVSKPYPEHSKDLTCPNAIHRIDFSCEKRADGILYISYDIDAEDDDVTRTIYEEEFSFDYMSVGTTCDSGSGLGYVHIEANEIENSSPNWLVSGTEENPFTFTEWYNRIRVGGTGNKYDKYSCRNMRHVTSEFKIDTSKNYTIDVWDAELYGPWILSFNIPHGYGAVDMSNTFLYNGIVYCYDTHTSAGDLLVTTMYNMYVVWNNSGTIGFIRYMNRYVCGDTRVDIVGCTIKSANPTYTANPPSQQRFIQPPTYFGAEGGF